MELTKAQSIFGLIVYNKKYDIISVMLIAK